MNNTLDAVMTYKYPGKKYTIRGGSVEWKEATPAPTQADLDTADAELTTFLSGKTTAENAVFIAINTRLNISVSSLAELKGKRRSIYDAIDAKEDQIISSGLTVEQKLNQLKQVWNARNKIESLLS
jgi:hypothetical protein